MGPARGAALTRQPGALIGTSALWVKTLNHAAASSPSGREKGAET